ncbi:ABC transporter ATP-binding protein [Candidatus Pelagibacter communis]|uniref:ABC transporter ATP-binding protein n=1 Tax=Pelagibacter ubique TaxID=198252 RepID=UPI000AD77FB6|nr:ABC transporter transmembrane domain-containing protein [Candidatus Pelagibacter ubique]|tara:strand:- start:3172 stop:4911 length:1740 start_codon:yes stop_codon:yes gene_type:complete
MMNNDYSILKRLYNDYTKKYVNRILLSLFFTLLLAGSTSAVAYLLDPAIKELFINQNKVSTYTIPGFIVLAFAIKGASLYSARVIMIRVAEEVRKDMQLDMFGSLISADTSLIDNKHSGKFITNLTNDIDKITNLVSTAILNLFKDSLTLIGLLSVMFYQNWKLSLMAIIMIPLASIAARTLGKRIGKVTTEQMTRAGILNTYLFEIFKNHKITKIFQKENFEKKRAFELINSLKEKNRKIAEVFVRASPIMEFLTGIMIATLIFVSAKLVANNEIEVSNFFSFLAAMMLAYQPVRSLATLNITIQQGLSGARKVLPIIDENSEVKDKEGAKDLKYKDGTIIFKNVDFNYSDEEKILKSINLNFPGKKMTALVGHSGAGKSTILNLIPRLYNVKNGDIEIDNQSIYENTIFSLRKGISLVSQDTTLFDDTIKNNIAYANLDASDDEIEDAAKNSFAIEFINKLPNKFNTNIGENGVRLSGGEKQRLSIARAILKKSPIILLDEATSSLDAETESKIQKAINFLTKGRTTIVIAHRLSTILNSDKIYVIDHGQVSSSGTHDELLMSSEIYKNFYEKQIKK